MTTRKSALIQLALDQLDLDAAVELAKLTFEFIDIFEVGTPCLKYNGANALSRIISIAAGKPVLADLKTMDAGHYEAEPFYELGASICTVLGAASTATIEGVVAAARKHAGRVQVDLINVSDKVRKAQELQGIGVDIIGVHTGIDSQQAGDTPFADLGAIAALNLNCTISVAGGLGPHTARSAMELGAEIIVVGGQITAAADPRAAAKALHQAIH
ncbi:MAG: 3-hexulose-6-phosphate synthase [Cyanobacteriota bacterium]